MLCTIPACNKKHLARGLCRTHYSRWRSLGDPLAVPPKMAKRAAGCSVDGCDAPYHQSGFCRPHYMRWYRHGDPLAGNAAAKFSLDEEGRQAYRRQHYQANKEAYIAKAQALSPETKRKAKAAWRGRNPELVRMFGRFRKKSLAQATPAWLTDDQWHEIDLVYLHARRMSAKTGAPYHVDHIVPLRGKLVCGLHVPWNLQVLTGEENTLKRNHFKPD